MLAMHQQIHQCRSQSCWCFCTFTTSAGARGAGSALADTPVQKPVLLVFLYFYPWCSNQQCWSYTGRYTDAGTSPAGLFVLLQPVQEPGVLVVPQQIHWCMSQPCWCFCNFFLHQCTTQLHCSTPPYYTSVLPSSSGNFVASYTSVLASSTGYIVAITPGAYIQCTPAQEPALLTFCEGVVTSSAGDFVAEWARL